MLIRGAALAEISSIDGQGRSGPAALTYARQSAESAFALDPAATLKVKELIDELKEHYTIVIVTDNSHQATPAANATAVTCDRQLFGHARTTGMFTEVKDEPTERDVTERFG